MVPIVFYACFVARIIVVPLTFSLTPTEVEILLEDCDANILITGVSTLQNARQANINLGLPLWVVSDSDDQIGSSHRDPAPQEDFTVVPVHDLRTLLNPQKELATQVVPKPLQETAVIGYSSGTTGKSKGAELTHYNLVAQLLQVNTLLQSYCHTGDTTVCILPLGHLFGLVQHVLWTFYLGITTVVMSHFELAPFLRNLER